MKFCQMSIYSRISNRIHFFKRENYIIIDVCDFKSLIKSYN